MLNKDVDDTVQMAVLQIGGYRFDEMLDYLGMIIRRFLKYVNTEILSQVIHSQHLVDRYFFD